MTGMQTPTMKRIPELHALYVQLTGMKISLTMERQRDWFEFLKKYGPDDLRDLVRLKRQKIKNGHATLASLKFRNLVVPLDWIEEDLEEYRAGQRRHVYPADKAAALLATGRPADPIDDPKAQDNVKKAGDIAAQRVDLAKKLHEWKEKHLK